MRGTDYLDTGGAGLRVGLCSDRFEKKRLLKTLPAFLGLPHAHFDRVSPENTRSFDLFVGWGGTLDCGNRALKYSTDHQKPFLLLEDGFLRSVFPNAVVRSAPLSLSVDDLGIYFDANTPSRLEELILKSTTRSPSPPVEGTNVILSLREKQLSKFNNFIPGFENGVQLGDRPVLVVDQLKGDKAISGALANQKDFELMLESARDENPGAEVIVKIHPITAYGFLPGVLSEREDLLSGCRVLMEQCNPWQLFKCVSSVYAVSSQLGFEAMMAGKKVRCFGMPFYAGWGLSHDEKTCSRRLGVRPTIQHIASATYDKYCRYVNPHTKARSTFSETVTTLTQLRDQEMASQ